MLKRKSRFVTHKFARLFFDLLHQLLHCNRSPTIAVSTSAGRKLQRPAGIERGSTGRNRGEGGKRKDELEQDSRTGAGIETLDLQ